jgi:mRNA-degrading endonuclease toxin of MazEF toxin-antitoxin module
MTTNGKDNRLYYRLPDEYFNKPSSVILSQIRVLDKSRFIEKIGVVEKTIFSTIKEKLTALIL